MGNLDVKKEIYNEYYETMKFTALRKVKNPEAAKNIADSLMNSLLFDDINSNDIDNPDLWIYRNINERSEKYLKDSKAQEEINFNQEIITRFMSLNDIEQEVVLFFYFYHISYYEISNLLNISVAEVKAYINDIDKKAK